MLTMLDKQDCYSTEVAPRQKKRKEWRCYSQQCTKDVLGVSHPGILVTKPAEDDTCPDCGDYLMLNLID